MKTSVKHNRTIFDKLYHEYNISNYYSKQPFEVYLYNIHNIKIQLGYSGFGNFIFDSEKDYFLFLLRYS